MRVNALRIIAIAMGIVLIDANLFGYDLLPDFIGLPVLFFCAVLMTDRAGRFARMAVVAAAMGFLEVVRIFSLAEAAPLVGFLDLLYLFLTVLLVITAADAVGQYSQMEGEGNLSRLCDVTGHIYALTFLFTVLSMWFEPLARMLFLINTGISVFVVIMFLYFYSAVTIAYHPDDPLTMEMEGDDGETPEGEEADMEGDMETEPEAEAEAAEAELI